MKRTANRAGRSIRDSRSVSAVRRFLETETAGGYLLLAAAAVALIWTNSGMASSYSDLWSTELEIPALGESRDLSHWINEGLMTLFFLVVGIEIKRELVEGELRDRRRAMLPIAAAFGGMVCPALIYLAFNHSGVAARGWGIPMATDIAFALGVLALLGSRVPRSLTVFLLSVAIVDDLGAIVVIALFYTSAIDWLPVLASVASIAAATALCRRPFGGSTAGLICVGGLGLLAWAFLLQSGVHATLAGVALGVALPLRSPAVRGEGRSRKTPRTPGVSERLEARVHPWSSFVVLPLFALANAGVSFGSGPDISGSGVFFGVFLGLVAGKALGIAGFSLLALRLGLGRLPRGVRVPHLWGVGVLGGIGFTVSLFITDLAFGPGEPAPDAKLAILAASVTAAVLGTVACRIALSRPVVPPGDD